MITASLTALLPYVPYCHDSLHALCDEIMPCLDETAQNEDIMAFAGPFEQLLDTVTAIKVSLAELDSGSATSAHNFPPSPLDARGRLPKLEIEPYDGDLLWWQEFWDSFETTDLHPKLTNQEKIKVS